MEIASLILGIISVILSFIPFVGIIAYLPAIIGIILGIVALATMKKRGKNKKAMPIIGIVTAGVSMILAIVMTFVWSFIGIGYFSEMVDKNTDSNSIYNSIYNNIYNSIENRYNNSTYDDDYDDDDYSDLDDIKEYKIGQKIKLEDFELTVNKVEKFDGDSNLKPFSGYELILVDISAKNISDDEQYIGTYDFQISDGDDFYSPRYDSSHKVATFQSKYLDRNETIDGTLCFEKKISSDDYYIVFVDEAKIKIK